MKRLISILLIVVIIFILSACGSDKPASTEETYAIVKLANGEIVEGKISSYMFGYALARVTFENGDVYKTIGTNVTIIVKGE